MSLASSSSSLRRFLRRSISADSAYAVLWRASARNSFASARADLASASLRLMFASRSASLGTYSTLIGSPLISLVASSPEVRYTANPADNDHTEANPTDEHRYRPAGWVAMNPSVLCG